jgi:hypothetical protein
VLRHDEAGAEVLPAAAANARKALWLLAFRRVGTMPTIVDSRKPKH